MRKRIMLYAIAELPVAALATTAMARDDGRGQSTMFDQENRHLTEIPHQADPRWEHCQELSRKMETLKGKPQRRYAAAQRYEAECKGLGN